MIKSVACQLLYKNGFWSWADLWDWQHEGALGVNPNVQIAWFCFPLLGLMSQVGGRCKICCGCLPPVPECRTVFPVEWDSRVDAMREALMVDPFVQSTQNWFPFMGAASWSEGNTRFHCGTPLLAPGQRSVSPGGTESAQVGSKRP